MQNQGVDSVFTYGMLVFSVLFLIGGITRIVEFSGLGLGRILRPILIAAHLVGCALFSSSMVVLAYDVTETRKTLVAILFFSGVGLLLPIHIFVGIKRRIKLRDADKSKSA
jgi:hypothetical protein